MLCACACTQRNQVCLLIRFLVNVSGIKEAFKGVVYAYLLYKIQSLYHFSMLRYYNKKCMKSQQA